MTAHGQIIGMLRRFFQNIPHELNEAARVDGCTHFQAFRRVIMPVLWRGVITTGLFSLFLLYNDCLITAVRLLPGLQARLSDLVFIVRVRPNRRLVASHHPHPNPD